ncbi:hypothetical protein ACFW3D_06490 [Streptomyces sp. NPDC058864]
MPARPDPPLEAFAARLRPSVERSTGAADTEPLSALAAARIGVSPSGGHEATVTWADGPAHRARPTPAEAVVESSPPDGR